VFLSVIVNVVAIEKYCTEAVALLGIISSGAFHKQLVAGLRVEHQGVACGVILQTHIENRDCKIRAGCVGVRSVAVQVVPRLASQAENGFQSTTRKSVDRGRRATTMIQRKSHIDLSSTKRTSVVELQLERLAINVSINALTCICAEQSVIQSLLSAAEPQPSTRRRRFCSSWSA
jgi:hypothetical protein